MSKQRIYVTNLLRTIGTLLACLWFIPAVSYGASGGAVTADGAYYIHTFTNNGTFNTGGAEFDAAVLWVGGGGSGSQSDSGPGGGGGVVYSNVMHFSPGSYPVVIGQSDQPTTFKGVTALAGGMGAYRLGTVNYPATAGGSGGGGISNNYNNVTNGAAGLQPGSADGGYGNAGGSAGSMLCAGGGGGAGTPGSNTTTTVPGMGGDGVSNKITGTWTWYGGGGGGYQVTTGPYGAPGGKGGGGGYNIMGYGLNGTNGLGGGGAGNQFGPTLGGSGTVIIRYLAGTNAWHTVQTDNSGTQFRTAWVVGGLFPSTNTLSLSLGRSLYSNAFGWVSNTNIMPAVSNVYDLGSALVPWRDLYLGNNSIYMSGVKVMEYSNGNLTMSVPVSNSAGTVYAPTGSFDSITLGGVALSGLTTGWNTASSTADWASNNAAIKADTNVFTGSTNIFTTVTVSNIVQNGRTTNQLGGNIRLTTISSTNAFITAAGTGLTFQVDGDQYGVMKFHLQNRNGVNGAMFEQSGSVDLVDFVFKGTNNQKNIRYENRAANKYVSGATTNYGEFQFGNPTSPSFIVGETNVSVRIGYLGVGTNLPSARLDVNGASVFRGTMNGSANQSTNWLVMQATTGNFTQVLGGGAGLTSLTYTNILTTNETITITNNTAVATAQAQINALNRLIPYGKTTTIIITGTQTWNNVMNISGFTGGGSLIIRGDNTDNANTNTNQKVFVDFSSGTSDGFYLEGNSVITYFQWLKIRVSDTVNKSCIWFVSSSMRHWLQYCYCYGIANTSGGPVGVRSTGSGGQCYVYLSMFGNCQFAVWADGSRVACDTLQSQVTNNVYGVYIGPAGILGRNGNQLTGTTAATLQQGGGIY